MAMPTKTLSARSSTGGLRSCRNRAAITSAVTTMKLAARSSMRRGKRQIRIVDVVDDLPLPVDLLPDDDVLAVVGNRGGCAVRCEIELIASDLDREVAGLRDVVGSQSHVAFPRAEQA